MLAPAESVMPWDLFIYKATLIAVVDLQYTLSYCTVVSSLIVHLYACMMVPIKHNFYKQQKPHIILLNRRLLHATVYMALIYRNVVLKIITC